VLRKRMRQGKVIEALLETALLIGPYAVTIAGYMAWLKRDHWLRKVRRLGRRAK
jgi:hypothetical protein